MAAAIRNLPLKLRTIEGPDWARSRRNPDLEAVIPRLRMAMAGL